VFTFILIIHIIVSVLLVIIILMQESKGGMSAMFGGGQDSYFGAAGAGKFFSKITTVLAIIFMLTSLSLSLFSRRNVKVNEGNIPPLPTQNKQLPSVPQNTNNPSDNQLPIVPQGENNTVPTTK